MFCTMNRALRRRRISQLKKICDEIETVLVSSKHLAFQLFDTAVYFVGLWSLLRWLLK